MARQAKHGCVTHVIFDMDGLLLDTEHLYTVATQKVVDQYGALYTWDIKSKLMGKRPAEVARIIIDTQHLYALATQEVAVECGVKYTETWNDSCKVMGRTMSEVAKIMIDTEILYTKATQAIVGEYGHTFTWDVKAKLMGKKSTEAAKIIIEALNLPLTVEEYIAKTNEVHDRLFPNAQFLPGAEKLVRHLHKHSIPIAVATGSSKYNYDLKTRNHQSFFELFHHIVLSGDDPDVKHCKPAPDCFNVAAERFGDNPKPDEVLIFEDAPNGVLGAFAAGMKCVWVPDERADQSELRDKATVVLKSLEEFVPEDFGLPPYNST